MGEGDVWVKVMCGWGAVWVWGDVWVRVMYRNIECIKIQATTGVMCYEDT